MIIAQQSLSQIIEEVIGVLMFEDIPLLCRFTCSRLLEQMKRRCRCVTIMKSNCFCFFIMCDQFIILISEMFLK